MARWVFVSAVAALAASCASAPKAELIRVAIAGIESRPPPSTGPLSHIAEDYLVDRLVACGRFAVVERRYMDRIHKESDDPSHPKPGKILGADWVIYGSLEWALKGAFDVEKPRCIGEVFLHLRVIRVEDGRIFYARSHVGSAEGVSTSEKDALLNRATQAAVDKLADDIIRISP